MIVTLCDRCKLKTEVWEVQISNKFAHPAAQYVPPKLYDLCVHCVADLDKFVKDGLPESE